MSGLVACVSLLSVSVAVSLVIVGSELSATVGMASPGKMKAEMIATLVNCVRKDGNIDITSLRSNRHAFDLHFQYAVLHLISHCCFYVVQLFL